jgi:hypothetical protein
MAGWSAINHPNSFEVGSGVPNRSKFLVCLARFDDAIAQPFQILTSYLAARDHRLNKVLRDAECLVISGWIVTLVATFFTTYGLPEKLLIIVATLVLLAAEKKLLMAHHGMCKLGWNRDVAELYRTSALRYKERFLVFRVLGLLGFASLPFISLLFAPEWQSADVTAYLTLMIYVCKFYIERSFPSDDWGRDHVPANAGKAGR